MREFKFKMWDKRHKIMFYPEFGGDEGQPYLFLDGSIMMAPEIKWDTFCLLLQYTGFKDRNGKEIYEGDIIKIPAGALYKVEYRRGEFILCFHENQLHLWYHKDGEIVGSIYENPELMEGEE